MKKIPICIVCLFLALGVKVQGMTFYSTLNTNSTEGNYYGTMYFSFSTSDNWYGTYSGVGSNYTDAITGTQISIDYAGGLAEGPNDCQLLVEMGVIDPYIGRVTADSLGNSDYTFAGWDDSSGGVLQSGQSTAIRYAGGGSDNYYSWTLNATGTVSFGYSLTGYFDGTSGSATGSWFFDYTVPPSIVSTPEPAVTLQLALGGCCLLFARVRQRRRN
jgi:hypothetical protein